MVRWSKGESGVLVSMLALGVVACGGGDDYIEPPSVPAPEAREVVGNLTGPMGLTFDRAGNLYIGSTTGRITRISRTGVREIWVETDHVLAGLSTGPQDEIFAALPNEGQVLAISQGRAQRIATSGLDTPTAIVFDSSQRALVSASGRRGEPQIAVIEIDTTYHTLTTEIRSPAGMVFSPDGWLYVADTDRNRVVRLQLDRFGEAGTPEVYASGIELPTGVAFDERGDLFVTGGNNIWIVRPNSTLQAYVLDGDLDYPARLAFAFGEGRDRGDLFLTNFGFPLGSGTTVAKTHVGIPGRLPYAP